MENIDFIALLKKYGISINVQNVGKIHDLIYESYHLWQLTFTCEDRSHVFPFKHYESDTSEKPSTNKMVHSVIMNCFSDGMSFLELCMETGLSPDSFVSWKTYVESNAIAMKLADLFGEEKYSEFEEELCSFIDDNAEVVEKANLALN